MRSAQTEKFWQLYRRHAGLNHADYSVTHFRTAPDTGDRLVDGILAGTMRAATGPMYFFEEGRYEPMPVIGDHVVMLDSMQKPRLIWRTTGANVAPLSAVTDEFVWRDGIGNGDRAEWLRLHQVEYTRQGRIYGFEMHDDIETMFVSFEVVWPEEAARRIRLVAPHLDRGIALLQRLSEQRNITLSLESILSRIQTAVMTVTPTLRVGFVNPAAETLLRREDGLLVKNGYLAARWPADHQRLAEAVANVSRAASPGVVFAIQRKDVQPAYRASAFALQGRGTAPGLARDVEVALFVDDPCEDTIPTYTDVYARSFQLTPAEARLAVHLASGVSLTEAAERFGITHNTVRAQLRSIFDKTDTHRQADLVRLLQNSGRLRVSLF